MTPRFVLVLSENQTLTRDLRAFVRWAREAEDAGFDAVMVSEHVVLGRDASAAGVMGNPREYALPGNQDPSTPWPGSLILLSAIASATTALRLAAAAILAPLRHPLALARDIGTLDLLSEGRLVVQPTVSWSRDEYAALGVPFHQRGEILDEQLEIWDLLWRGSPVSYSGKHFSFSDVHFEPRAHRPDGPRMWFGGQHLHDRLLHRLLRYGHGFHPLGRPTPDDLARLRAALGGRELEMIGGVRPTFPDDHSPAPLAPALESIPEQVAEGFTTFCIKPSQFVDDPDAVGPFCREVVARAEALLR
ncbi:MULTISPECIES: LLM class flavin-dependent oxidoreductase [Actinomadura]|uniref:LLM class flavin-dependent oxidoreductase n=1 Tax=Actinomadura yumaensis TaxID=111807 RepID=A0ABW2CQA9_9ACTN|nr:LLM class flavin-dependent oxidoreductase [Actinomadura sp. J1-007]MWK37327.1 LLM class flavin-dependent oxidoreductase [Actinomadura sp. J1-007]